jgi:opacity protein-like surface antigen
MMKKTSFLAAAALAVISATSALAADMPVKVTKAPPAPVSPWDLAFGAAAMSDYVFRGITQSDHKPSVAEYQELRYNWNPTLQSYFGVSGESIDFPNHAAAEVDFYGGIRPTVGPVAFDLGIWYYYYPGGQCYGGGLTASVAGSGCILGQPPNLNQVKADLSFIEYYGKAVWNVNDSWALGANEFYDPDWLNSGAWGNYTSGTIKYTAPSTVPLPAGVGFYASGEFGHYWFGTPNFFYTSTFPAPLTIHSAYPGYNTWNAGLGFTYKVFTLDLRYSGTDLSRQDCGILTSDGTAGINSAGVPQSTWCGNTFIAKFAFDLTLANLK